jgi:hypothetical protein
MLEEINFAEDVAREVYPSLHSNGSLYRKFNNLEEAKEFSKH